MGIENSDLEAKLMPNDPYWLQKIGVIRNEHRSFEAMLMAVVNKVSRNVDIGALFLRASYLGKSRVSRSRLGNRHHDIVGEKRAVDDLQLGERPKGTKVDLLAGRLIWVGFARADSGTEVLDPGDRMARKK
jgi:hypothetical protein